MLISHLLIHQKAVSLISGNSQLFSGSIFFFETGFVFRDHAWFHKCSDQTIQEMTQRPYPLSICFMSKLQGTKTNQQWKEIALIHNIALK